MLTSRWHVAGAAVIAVALAGCSSGDGSSGDTGTTTSTTAGSAPAEDVVEVPQVSSDTAGDYVAGTDVAIGRTADAGGLLITVESIAAGDVAPEPDDGAGTTIDVVATLENTTDLDLAGPDVYTVCTDDGRTATTPETSDTSPLETVPAGESRNADYVVGVPDDCTEVLLQARVLPTDAGGDHIAQWTIPSDALL
ncbi:MAG: hypothetical protein R3A49_12790 [Acidimicrobiia bacterium]